MRTCIKIHESTYKPILPIRLPATCCFRKDRRPHLSTIQKQPNRPAFCSCVTKFDCVSACMLNVDIVLGVRGCVANDHSNLFSVIFRFPNDGSALKPFGFDQRISPSDWIGSIHVVKSTCEVVFGLCSKIFVQDRCHQCVCNRVLNLFGHARSTFLIQLCNGSVRVNYFAIHDFHLREFRFGCEWTFEPLGYNLVVFHGLCAFKNPCQRVVVGCRDRIKFMVMATSTSYRHSHECLTKRAQLFVDDIHLHFEGIILSQHFRANHQESRCYIAIERVIVRQAFSRNGFQQIARNLFLNKTIVWNISIEARNHVVSIPEGIGVSNVLV